MLKHRLELNQVVNFENEILSTLQKNAGGCDEIWLFLDRRQRYNRRFKEISSHCKTL